MHPPGRAYSRMVAGAKIVLPLIALAILSMLFLLARSAPEGEPLRFVEEDVRELAESQRLGAPRHAAVTGDAAQVTITAAELQRDPQRPDITRGRQLRARLATPDGQVYDIRSRAGTLDEVANQSILREDVEVATADGYTLVTDALRLRNDRTYLESLAPVRAWGPLGTLEAERMEIFAVPGDERQTRMVFTGNVHLRHIPQQGRQ